MGRDEKKNRIRVNGLVSLWRMKYGNVGYKKKQKKWVKPSAQLPICIYYSPWEIKIKGNFVFMFLTMRSWPWFML